MMGESMAFTRRKEIQVFGWSRLFFKISQIFQYLEKPSKKPKPRISLCRKLLLIAYFTNFKFEGISLTKNLPNLCRSNPKIQLFVWSPFILMVNSNKFCTPEIKLHNPADRDMFVWLCVQLSHGWNHSRNS